MNLIEKRINICYIQSEMLSIRANILISQCKDILQQNKISIINDIMVGNLKYSMLKGNLLNILSQKTND